MEVAIVDEKMNKTKSVVKGRSRREERKNRDQKIMSFRPHLGIQQNPHPVRIIDHRNKDGTRRVRFCIVWVYKKNVPLPHSLSLSPFRIDEKIDKKNDISSSHVK